MTGAAVGGMVVCVDDDYEYVAPFAPYSLWSKGHAHIVNCF